jgi:hypothetical protein
MKRPPNAQQYAIVTSCPYGTKRKIPPISAAKKNKYGLTGADGVRADGVSADKQTRPQRYLERGNTALLRFMFTYSVCRGFFKRFSELHPLTSMIIQSI